MLPVGFAKNRVIYFRIGFPERAGLDGIRIHPAHMVLVFEVEPQAGGGIRESLDGRWLRSGASPYAFRLVGGAEPVVELVDRPEPSACAIL